MGSEAGAATVHRRPRPTQPHFRQAEPGRITGYDQVAAQGDLEAPAQRIALNGSDQRLRHGPVGKSRETVFRHRRNARAHELTQIHAGREMLAGPRYHSDAQITSTLELGKSGIQLVGELLIHRVAGLRPVQG